MDTISGSDVQRIKTFIASLSHDEREWFEDAVELCRPQNGSHKYLIQKNIIWLIGVGKEFFMATPPSKSQVLEQLKEIKDHAHNLSMSLHRAYPKTQYLVMNEELFSKRAASFFDSPLAKDFIRRLETLSTAADLAYKQHKDSSKTEWINPGVSMQDELVGFCLGIFEKFQPGVAANSEENPIHRFAQTIYSLSSGEFREKSLMGSIRKALNSRRRII